MKVFHFGPVGRQLLGTAHLPQRLRPRSAMVVLCNPFGEEAARAHRIYRVLATHLERAGYPVLRFDYYGTGDSMGDSAEGSIAGWISDIGLAVAELTREAGPRKLVAIGLRLGGTLAALAASRGGLRLRHLVLWDPIVSGAAYLEQLGAMHRAYARDEGFPQLGEAAPLGGVLTEALGTPITAGLATELAGLDLTAEPFEADNITVISTKDTDDLGRLRSKTAAAPGVRWVDLPASTAWNSDSGLNAAIVPMDAVQAIVARVQEISP